MENAPRTPKADPAYQALLDSQPYTVTLKVTDNQGGVASAKRLNRPLSGAT